MSRGSLVRRVLDNGLRVVVLDEPQLSAVGVAVAYDVGYRTEARPGFAHLFEHLMFTGGDETGRAAYARRVQAAGGVFNGTTHRDHTAYFQALPPASLAEGLELEAGRMRALNVTAQDVATQVSVVTEEIRRNLLNRPYGGFPTFHLPPALFHRRANTHDGYGDIVSLAGADVAECAAFHEAYYHPGNAVLAIGGPVRPDEAFALADRYFGAIPAQPGRPRPDLSEPPLDAVRQIERTDPLAPAPALALGWRAPDPRSRQYLAAVVASGVLGGGESGRLTRAIAHEYGPGARVMVLPGLTGAPFESRDPDAVVVSTIFGPHRRHDEIAATVLRELTILAQDGPAEAEVRRATARLRAGWYRDLDPIGARTRRVAAFDLLHGDGELAFATLGQLAGVRPDEVRAAAAALVSQQHAAVHLMPGAATKTGSAANSGPATTAGSAKSGTVPVGGSR